MLDHEKQLRLFFQPEHFLNFGLFHFQNEVAEVYGPLFLQGNTSEVDSEKNPDHSREEGQKDDLRDSRVEGVEVWGEKLIGGG